MNPIIMGLLLVFALAFLPVEEAEPASVVDESGCVQRFSHHHRTDGTVSMLVQVGARWLYFNENVIKTSGPVVFLTRAQVAAWESLLAEFRAAAAAKVKARIWHDSITGVLSAHTVDFNVPC